MRSVLGILFGLALVWLGTWGSSDHDARALELHESGERATGTVVEVVERERTERSGGRRSRSTRTYTEICPRVTFTVGDQERSFVEYDDCDRLEVGDEVSVMYDAADPYGARIDSESVLAQYGEGRRLTWWLYGLGGLFVTVSAVTLVVRVRSRWVR